jgi:hypothetical protein
MPRQAPGWTLRGRLCANLTGQQLKARATDNGALLLRFLPAPLPARPLCDSRRTNCQFVLRFQDRLHERRRTTHLTHLLTKVTDPSGRVIEETAYDSESRAYRQWDGAGNLLVEIDYSLANTHVITESGTVMTHTYDIRGTLKSLLVILTSDGGFFWASCRHSFWLRPWVQQRVL